MLSRRHDPGPARRVEQPSDLAAAASRSIGDAYIVAAGLPENQGATLIASGKAAFSQTHVVLLTSAAAVIMALAGAVWITLAAHRPSADAATH